MEDVKVSALRTEEDETASNRGGGIKLPDMPKVNLEELSKGSRQQPNNETASLYSAGGDSSSAKHANAGNTSNRMTPRGLSAASQSYKERRDIYKMKSSVKGRDSVQGLPPSTAGNAAEEPVNNYSDIISRIEKNLAVGPSVDVSASK